MDIGIPKESLAREHRVALAPSGVKTLVERGHRVYVETGAGGEAGHGDGDYQSAGATVVYARDEVFHRSGLLLGVQAPAPADYLLLQPGQTVLAFWMLPALHAESLRVLMDRQITAIGLEAIEDDDGRAPALTSMSEIAGALAVIVGAGLLLNEFGGKGILLTGAPGVPPAQLVILGAGVLGQAAARAAAGLGAEVLLLDVSTEKLREAVDRLPGRMPTMVASPHNIERALSFADLVIAAPAVHGDRAPVVITRAMLKRMKPRSVIMDFAIDMGGCLETSRPTYFPNPTYEVDGILHFCVPNLPAIVARSATLALTNTVGPWVMELAEKGTDAALAGDRALRRGAYLHGGRCVKESLSQLFGLPFQPFSVPER
ncbi:MAG: alanine dehydrogenase [Gemmatimonadota bacterium]